MNPEPAVKNSLDRSFRSRESHDVSHFNLTNEITLPEDSQEFDIVWYFKIQTALWTPMQNVAQNVISVESASVSK
jgi:hypothetical protein